MAGWKTFSMFPPPYEAYLKARVLDEALLKTFEAPEVGEFWNQPVRRFLGELGVGNSVETPPKEGSLWMISGCGSILL